MMGWEKGRGKGEGSSEQREGRSVDKRKTKGNWPEWDNMEEHQGKEKWRNEVWRCMKRKRKEMAKRGGWEGEKDEKWDGGNRGSMEAKGHEKLYIRRVRDEQRRESKEREYWSCCTLGEEEKVSGRRWGKKRKVSEESKRDIYEGKEGRDRRWEGELKEWKGKREKVGFEGG